MASKMKEMSKWKYNVSYFKFGIWFANDDLASKLSIDSCRLMVIVNLSMTNITAIHLSWLHHHQHLNNFSKSFRFVFNPSSISELAMFSIPGNRFFSGRFRKGFTFIGFYSCHHSSTGKQSIPCTSEKQLGHIWR